MALFIYPSSKQEALIVAINEARKCQNTRTMGVSAKDMRTLVRAMSYHDVLLIPGVEHCTPEVERLKIIAHNLGLEVRPLIAHLDKELHPIAAQYRNRAPRGAAARAASPTQLATAVAPA